MHGGTHLTVACIRHMFWIIKVKMKVKSFIRNCVKCARYTATSVQQRIGNLPAERVRPSRPFQLAGIDYAGPYSLRIEII